MQEINYAIILNNTNDFNKLLKWNIWMMKCFGYITFSYQKYPNFHYYRGIFLIIFLSFSGLIQLISISPIYFHLSLRLISTSISALLLLMTAIFQIIGFLINRKYFVKNLQFINDDINMILHKAPADHILFYNKYVKRTKQINTVLWTAGLVSGGLMLIGTISFYIFKPEIFQLEQILTAKPIPFILAIFPYRNITSNYFIAYILPIFAFLMGGLLIPSCHSFSFGLLMYALFRIKFINFKLKTFQPPNYLPVNSKNYHKIMRNHFSSSIEEQTMIRKYLRELEILIAPSILFEFILCSILICFLLYCISVDCNSIYTPIYIIFLFAIILTQFLHHGLANEIAIESERTSLSIYLSPWYTYPLTYQKICLIMMINSKSLQLRAFMVQMKLATFIRILRASYSFFALLKNFEG